MLSICFKSAFITENLHNYKSKDACATPMGQCHCQNSWTWWLIESKMIDFHPNWVLWRPKRLSFQTPSSLTLITIFFHLYFFIVFYHFYLVFFFEIMILVCLFFSLDWLVFSYGFFVLCSFVFVLCVCGGGDTIHPPFQMSCWLVGSAIGDTRTMQALRIPDLYQKLKRASFAKEASIPAF